MAGPVFTITQGARSPSIGATLTDANGAVNLTTASGVTFDMRLVADGTLKVDAGTATIVDAAAGKVAYPWATNDTNTVGVFQGKFTVTWADAKKTMFPTSKTPEDNYITINVVDDARAVN